MTVTAEIDERIGKCRKILDMDPNSQIFAALAEAYRRKGDLEAAFRVCQNGLRIHPSYGSAHVVMAKINLDRGLYDWAEAEVAKSVELDGSNRAVELLSAEICIYKGEFARAVKQLKKLSLVDPGSSQIQKLLEIAQKIPAERKAEQKRQQAQKEKQEQTAITAGQTAQPESPAGQLQKRKLSTTALLKEAMQLPGLTGSLFINTEGLVVESEWASDIDATVCGAALAEVNKMLNQELVKASFGEVDQVLIETSNHVWCLLRIENGMILLAALADVNLGSLRMRMSDLIGRYQPE